MLPLYVLGTHKLSVGIVALDAILNLIDFSSDTFPALSTARKCNKLSRLSVLSITYLYIFPSCDVVNPPPGIHVVASFILYSILFIPEILSLKDHSNFVAYNDQSSLPANV